MPAYPARVFSRRRQPGLQEPGQQRDQVESAAVRSDEQDPDVEVQGLRRQSVRDRGLAGHRAPAVDGSGQETARRQPDGTAAYRIDAARFDDQEYRSVLQRGAAAFT